MTSVADFPVGPAPVSRRVLGIGAVLIVAFAVVPALASPYVLISVET